MKSILHIIDTTGPGGAETVFIDLISHLSERRYRSVVVIRGSGWVRDELNRRGIKPVIIDAKGSFNWRYLRRLMALIREEKIDLIQSHLLGSNIYTSLAGIMTRVPVVATFHGAVDVSEQERFLSIKMAAINLGATDIITVSENLRTNIVERTSLRPGKISVIYNGIATHDFQREKSAALRQSLSFDDKDIIVGSLGNIRPAKAYDILLQAAHMLKNSEFRFRFVIAGHYSGELYQRLLDLKTELDLDGCVYFTGFEDEPAKFLSNLDIFLLSSSSEGFSIATVQAMASGVPVVATRSGGPQEIISHDKNGYLVSPGSPREIADALNQLAADPASAERLAQAGRQHAIETFDIRQMVDAYEDVYQRNIK